MNTKLFFSHFRTTYIITNNQLMSNKQDAVIIGNENEKQAEIDRKAEAEQSRIEEEQMRIEAETLISEKCSPAPDFFKQTDFCKKYFTHPEPELDEFELAQIHHCGTVEEQKQPEKPKTDKQKMESLLEFFKEIKLPEFESDEAKKAVLSVKELLRKTISFIETTTKKMQ